MSGRMNVEQFDALCDAIDDLVEAGHLRKLTNKKGEVLYKITAAGRKALEEGVWK